MVSNEYVEEVGVASELGVPEGDQLPVPGRGRVAGRPHQELGVLRDERGGDEQWGRGGRGRTVKHLGRGLGVAADQAVEEGGVVVGHSTDDDPTR